MRIVTKVGARRDTEGNWPRALAPDELSDEFRAARNTLSAGQLITELFLNLPRDRNKGIEVMEAKHWQALAG